jgi:hypothetical protein
LPVHLWFSPRRAQIPDLSDEVRQCPQRFLYSIQRCRVRNCHILYALNTMSCYRWLGFREAGPASSPFPKTPALLGGRCSML